MCSTCTNMMYVNSRECKRHLYSIYWAITCTSAHGICIHTHLTSHMLSKFVSVYVCVDVCVCACVRVCVCTCMRACVYMYKCVIQTHRHWMWSSHFHCKVDCKHRLSSGTVLHSDTQHCHIELLRWRKSHSPYAMILQNTHQNNHQYDSYQSLTH